MTCRRRLPHAVMLVLLLSSPAGGAEPGGPHARALLTISQVSGYLPENGEPIKCGLPLIAYARQHHLDAPAGVLEAMRLLDARPTLQASTVAGHFRIHFDTTGQNTPAMMNAAHTSTLPGTWQEYVDSVVASTVWVYHVEVDSLGYAAPPGDGSNGGGPEYDIYIMNLANAGYAGTYGFTAPDSNVLVDGDRSSTFIVVDNTFSFLTNLSNRGIRALDVTIAHEFHHAIQIGSYGFWLSEVYYHEMTSVWMESVGYPAVDDYLQYVRSSKGEFANPDVPFNTNSLIMYSRGIWGHFIAKRHGMAAMRHSWEEIRHMRPLQAIDAALRTYHNSSLAVAFADWGLWNYFTGSRADSVDYYPSGAQYPLITEQTFSYSGASRPVPGSPASLAPLATSYFSITGGTQPLELITCNVDVSLAESGSMGTQDFSYDIGPVAADAGYRGTTAGIFVKLNTAVLSKWWSWDVVNGIVGTPPFDEARPFPNPFVADGLTRLCIPSAELEGELSVYSGSMTRVYQASLTSVLRLGRRVFVWDGRSNDGRQAESGVYVYVLSIPGRIVAGKIALIRKH